MKICLTCLSIGPILLIFSAGRPFPFAGDLVIPEIAGIGEADPWITVGVIISDHQVLLRDISIIAACLCIENIIQIQ